MEVVLAKATNRKVTGLDDINSELIKYGDS